MSTQENEQGRFDAAITDALPRLRAVVRRIVGHPEETDDVVNEALTRAWSARATFRGDSAFSTWLCAIGVRAALDHVRRAKRWRSEAQLLHAAACGERPDLAAELGGAVTDASFGFEVREHVAYCLLCTARSLPAEERVALLLRDAGGLGNREAARAAGTSESVLRHRLASARAQMTRLFEERCALVNHRGACWQCAGLREAAPPERRGPPVEALAGDSEHARYQSRLDLVAQADLDGGSRALHDVSFRHLAALEDEGFLATALPSCAPTDEAT